MNLDTILDLLADRVAVRVVKLIGKEPDALYSSEAPPEHVSKRTFNTWCRSGKVNGARREGRGPSTRWICTREAWERSRTTTTVVNDETENKVAGYIDAAGLRLTSPSRRGGR